MSPALAAIADRVAAAGVIGSLLFLALQVREQNPKTVLNNWRELLETLTDFKGLTHNPQLADLIVRGHAEYHALRPAEKLSFGNYLEQGVHIIGNFDKHAGTVPRQMADLHLAVHNLMPDHLNSPGARAWWAESKPKGRFMPNTVKRIDAILAEGQAHIANATRSVLTRRARLR